MITSDNVEKKNLAATSGDAGMPVKNATSHLGVFRDLLIYAVDDDGDRIALGSEKIAKYGACASNQMLCMLIKGSTTINLRFNWGHMENGVWTPNALPSFVLTFVDSKAGNTTWAAETVSTSDATRCTAGASITVVPHLD